MHTRSIIGTALLVAAAISFNAPAAAQEEPPSLLPGGATSLTETHGDWVVRCQLLTNGEQQERACSMSQRQVTQQGQQIMAIELAPQEETMNGIAVMPFGLDVTGMISMSVDEGSEFASLPFSTCLQGGCVVPLAFNSDAVSAMRAGTELRLQAGTPQNEQYQFAISLSGFSAAANRLTELNES